MAKNILVIDDDEDFIASTRTVLESKGYTVSSAQSKAEGMEKINRSSPDLIIMDVMMDKMSDGFDLTRKIKSSERYKNIPILMLTSVRDKTGFKFSSEAGDNTWLPVEDYAEKPIKPSTLISKIENLLKKG